MEIFETGHALLATLGYPLFDPVGRTSGAAGADEMFFCSASDSEGRGRYTPEGFVVLEGSTGRRDVVKSLVGTAHERARTGLLSAGVLRVVGDRVVFQRDHLFRTPSGAAIALLGRTANGWLEWRSPAGQTLDTLKRQAVD